MSNGFFVCFIFGCGLFVVLVFGVFLRMGLLFITRLELGLVVKLWLDNTGSCVHGFEKDIACCLRCDIYLLSCFLAFWLCPRVFNLSLCHYHCYLNGPAS